MPMTRFVPRISGTNCVITTANFNTLSLVQTFELSSEIEHF